MASVKAGHLGLLCSYARGIGIAEEIAIEIYEAECERLSAAATIKRYIGVIAEKHAKEALRTRTRTRVPAPRPAAPAMKRAA